MGKKGRRFVCLLFLFPQVLLCCRLFTSLHRAQVIPDRLQGEGVLVIAFLPQSPIHMNKREFFVTVKPHNRRPCTHIPKAQLP